MRSIDGSRPVRLTSRAHDQGAPTVWGLASSNATTQCFIVWSRTKQAPRTVRLSVRLRGQPAAAAINLYTLGPKHDDFIWLQSVPLPKPPERMLSISLELAKAYQVMQGCVGIAAVSEASHVSAIENVGGTRGEAASGGSYSRHDVLVPRGTDASKAPAGMGHYDTWRRTLTVAIAATGSNETRVGLAGVVLRDLQINGSLRFSLSMHASSTAHPATVAAVAMRVDFLVSKQPTPLASVQLNSAAAAGGDEAALWGGAAAAWPPAAAAVRHGSPLDFDRSGGATASLQIDQWAPAEWAAADQGARRARVSLLLRPATTGVVQASPVTLSATVA